MSAQDKQDLIDFVTLLGFIILMLGGIVRAASGH